MKLIAEIRKLNPYSGACKIDLDPTKLTEEYVRLGASAISVQTSPDFKGDCEWIKQIRKATVLPILRRDVVTTEDEVKKTKEMGADWILLRIVDYQDPESMAKIIHAAWWNELKPIIEGFFVSDIVKSSSLDMGTILVNSYHTKTGKLYHQNKAELAKIIPDHLETIGSGGIKERKQLVEMKEQSFDWVVIGDTFLKSSNLEETFKELWMPNGEKNFN